MTQRFKDDQLVALAAHHNVAQFVSFGPGAHPQVRHSRIRGNASLLSSPEDAVRRLLGSVQTCNIRTFRPYPTKGTPFPYGISKADEVLELVHKFARQDYYTIVNETIDVNDGGVSGVAWGDVIEFAPHDTPRAVEHPGILSAQYSLGVKILASVYGFMPDIPNAVNQRVEFSLHPGRVGYAHDHTILWQIDDANAPQLNAPLRWPNNFSRFLGDKAFGLLVADSLGVPVPKTIVVPRGIAPFIFGRPTPSGERWIRTCPDEPDPGRYPTFKGWTDPFRLMDSIGQDANSISSVLGQDGVDAEFSGATRPEEDGLDRIEGVTGQGDEFMLARRAPDRLPEGVIRDVRQTVSQLRNVLGDVRLEWAHDSEIVWVLQLHIAKDRAQTDMISPGTAKRWLRFDPNEGLDRLRELVRVAHESAAGVEIIHPIGMTSHVGEILRGADVPARLVINAGAKT